MNSSVAKNISLLLFFGILFAPQAAIAEGENGPAVVKAFEKWMKKYKVRKGAIAVSYNGKMIATGGKRRKADAPAPIASLSKAITAACVIKAIEGAGKNAKQPLLELIPETLSKLGKGKDERFIEITASQLIAHSSGLNPDITQKKLGRLKSMKFENKEWQYKRQIKHKLAKGPGSEYFYNNMNYLILGLMIEELSGIPNEKYCFDTILKPLGINTASFNPAWKVMSTYGAWKISAVDYLKLVDWVFADNKVLGNSPFSMPSISLGNGASYGMGAFLRRTSDGFNFWHFGRWGGTSRTKANFGAYFAKYAGGYAVAVNYAYNPNNKKMGELDNSLYRAAHK